MKLEEQIEDLYRSVKQLNKSAMNVGVYDKPQYKKFNNLIEEYHKRKDIDSINKVYTSIKLLDLKDKVKRYER